MLEVHVDVGGLVAFPADESPEQGVAALRVDRSDAQAITHRAVRSGSPALTQNALVTGELDDVVDGQKIGFVLQFLDQCQFVVELGVDIGRDGGTKAPVCAQEGFLPQVCGGRHPRRADFIGVFVFQLVQIEWALCGHLDGAL